MTSDGFAPFVPRVVIVRRQPHATPLDLGREAVTVEEVLPVPDRIDIKAPAEVRDDEANCRERAIKIAGEACARALRQAIARNPLFVARFVDDAMEAAGRETSKSVRLSPADAAACRDRVPTSVVADDALAPGEVVVEAAHGIVTATIDERARILVRAVADSS